MAPNDQTSVDVLHGIASMASVLRKIAAPISAPDLARWCS